MVEKILLISGSELNNGVGEQFIASMIKNCPNDSIMRYVFSSTLQDGNRTVNNTNTIIRHTKYSSVPIVSIANHHFYKTFQSERHINHIKETVVNNGISIIWIVLNSDQIILSAASLVDLDVKIVAHIWDTPEYICEANRLGSLIKKNTMAAFNTIMNRADHIVAISNNMAKIYNSMFNKPTEVMYFASSNDFINRNREIQKEDSTFEIIFAGSLYAWKEWNAFLAAIEEHNESVNLPKINISFYGSPSRWAKMPKWIDQHGPISASEALLQIAKADAAYLPYWMDKKHADTVKMAFPSKMAFYCTASTPIFYHGPEESNPTVFLNENPVGIACSSTNGSIIIEKLLTLKSETFLEKHNDCVKQTYRKFFHIDAPSDIFLKTIQCLRN